MVTLMFAPLKTVPIRTFIVPALLTAAVLHHMWGFYHHDRSSWGTGLSFGMFATCEAHGSRWIVVNQDEGKRLVFDWASGKSTPLVAQTLASPTQARMDQCAARFGGKADLYGVRFEPATATLRSILIRSSSSNGVHQ